MKKLILMFLASIAVIFGVVATDQTLNPAQASGSDVVPGGTHSAAAVRNAFNNNKPKGTTNIFKGMGLTSSIINNSTVKSGTVYKDGRVVVGGKVVANNAWSAGRTVMSHTKKRVKRTYNGTVYYESPTSDSFRSSSLAAFVYFDKNGIFQGAVIKVCGNPVRATAVKPKPEPKKIKVCRLKDKKYPVTIKETEFDPKKHSMDPEDCKPEEIEVCRLKDKKYPVTIKKDEFDPKKHSMDPKDCEEVIIPDTPGVSITKKVDSVDFKQVEIGEIFTYQIKVANTGDVDLKDVLVTDKAPAGVTLLEASHGKVTDNNWSYTIPELKIGKFANFTITAKVAEYIEGKLVNTACVDAPSVPGNPDDCDDATVAVDKPEAEDMVVCRLEDNTYPVTIKKDEFDPELHSTDPADCAVEEEPEDVEELPQTGVADGILSSLGLGSLVTTTLAYVASKRNGLIG